ncbi:lipopolysaccharide biosynthesis protein [Seonamhaeicola maritimus]|uniref:Oligosaccharide flippase family protein n=1 Tax=Seonamhaeicola maritimus TaxID=2591822 RepID=A0A5C7GHN6_9FLAO|nr:polysaccharide biosynthesis C-terminal domain-containing protein [Seonamhaeicola maritimus]TXG37118.1 oligosaccharide flippase family protein [Seonamhaeicola maritimus]
MSAFKSLFKQTFIYGLATVLPRMLTFLLTPLYTEVMAVGVYGKVSIIFSWFAIFNVILAYGMETAFFRFFNKEDNQDKVVGTATLSVIFTSLAIFGLAFLFQNQIANVTDIEVHHIRFVIWILLLDALVIIPFAWLRANAKPMKYAVIKIVNVAINIGLNLFFFLLLSGLAKENDLFASIYKTDFEISYVLIANLVASGITLILMLSFYGKIKYKFNSILWQQMLRYAYPVLIAGLAYTTIETFNRILLDSSLSTAENPEDEVGMFSACYKLALFMTLFATAFRLGIEPYFFSHAKSKNPQKNYAKILEYFVIFGSGILLTVVVLSDILKVIIIRDEDFWEAMWIVPIILIASFCLGIYHNLSVWYKITDRTKFGAYISVVGAIITLVLNIWLIPIISYKGSAIATLAAYGSMVLLSYYFGRKYYPIPYNLKKIGLYLTMSILFSLVYFYQFRENYVIGISMLVVFLGVISFSEKNQIKQILKR